WRRLRRQDRANATLPAVGTTIVTAGLVIIVRALPRRVARLPIPPARSTKPGRLPLETALRDAPREPTPSRQNERSRRGRAPTHSPRGRSGPAIRPGSDTQTSL